MNDACEVRRNGDGATSEAWRDDLYATDESETAEQSYDRFLRVMKVLSLDSLAMQVNRKFPK